MSEAMAVFIAPVFFAVLFGAMGAVYFLSKDRKKVLQDRQELERRSVYLDEQLKRVGVLSKKFDAREPRFVRVKAFDAADPEYRRSLRSISDSEAFQWFLYQMREGTVERMKSADPNNTAMLVSQTAFITAVDEILNALALNSRELIDLEQGEENEEV